MQLDKKICPPRLTAAASSASAGRSTSSAVGIEGPSLVRLLDQLGAAGLVVRQEDPTDRRAKVLSLTPAGRAVVATMETALERLREEIFAAVSDADLEASLRVFRAVQAYDRAAPRTESKEAVR